VRDSLIVSPALIYVSCPCRLVTNNNGTTDVTAAAAAAAAG
jgi:hypothetical protein